MRPALCSGRKYLRPCSRLRQIDLTEEIGARIRAGLPYVGFSAGAVLCGLDILNSQDINAAGHHGFSMGWR